jgi:glutamine amidotransferase
MIGVVDYRAGNAPSVLYALERLGLAATRVDDAAGLDAVDRVILPGVGAAAATIASLEESTLVTALTRRVVDERVPFLGICIGLQVLFDHSEEGDADGLGWVPGRVRRFPDTDRVPQIGWNEVRVARAHPLVAGWPEHPYCYFVNSFHAVPDSTDAVLATTDYSVPFCSMVAAGNIAATQFHAEKSGEIGLAVLTNFATWDGAAC